VTLFPERSRISFIRWGSFSGSAIALRAALERRVAVDDDIDLAAFGRDHRLLARRIGAHLEALRERVPWPRTTRWSQAIERALLDRHLTPGRRVLFIQTLAATRLPEPFQYWIFTDRVAAEGAAGDPRFAAPVEPQWLEREHDFVRAARSIFVMGPSTATALAEHYGVPGERVQVVGSGPNSVLGDGAARHACRRFLFVGTQWALKGGPEILAAFERVRARSDFDVTLEIVGCTPPVPASAGVIVTGRVAHGAMRDVWNRADALVLPTRFEAFGVVLVEALLQGLPVIATSIGNQPWIVDDGGLIVPPGDVDALANAMTAFITDYAAFAARARTRGSRMRARFSWDVIATTIAEEIAQG